MKHCQPISRPAAKAQTDSIFRIVVLVFNAITDAMRILSQKTAA